MARFLRNGLELDDPSAVISQTPSVEDIGKSVEKLIDNPVGVHAENELDLGIKFVATTSINTPFGASVTGS